MVELENPQSQRLLNFWGNSPTEEEYYKLHNVTSSHSFYTSPRGLSLFTRSWLPLSSPPRGVICMVHGYGNDISWTFQSTAVFLAGNGFACFALDLQGHGRSQGLRAYVPDVDLVAQDCFSFFSSVLETPTLRGLPAFLYGESMGGAICLLIHLSNPTAFRSGGAILVAPMCRISDRVRPRWPIPQILMFLARFFPTLPAVPAADLMERSVRVPEKRIVAGMNPRRYVGRPRLGTVAELLRVTEILGNRLGEVEIPFLVVHGSEDGVTDPEVSRGLFEEARSGDKSIRVYEGMLHSLLFGETDENVERVRGDILAWLNQRS